MIILSFKLGGWRNLLFKLQISSKGSACNTFGISHVCSVSWEEESSLTPQLPFLVYLEAASPGSVLPGQQPGCLPNLGHVLLEGARRRKLFRTMSMYTWNLKGEDDISS